MLPNFLKSSDALTSSKYVSYSISIVLSVILLILKCKMSVLIDKVSSRLVSSSDERFESKIAKKLFLEMTSLIFRTSTNI